MENNRVVTGFAVCLYGILGLLAIVVAVVTGNVGPLGYVLLIPGACLVVVLLQFVVAGPLMLLTAWLSGGRKTR